MSRCGSAKLCLILHLSPESGPFQDTSESASVSSPPSWIPPPTSASTSSIASFPRGDTSVWCCISCVLNTNVRRLQKRLYVLQHFLRGLQQRLHILRQFLYALLQRRKLGEFLGRSKIRNPRHRM